MCYVAIWKPLVLGNPFYIVQFCTLIFAVIGPVPTIYAIHATLKWQQWNSIPVHGSFHQVGARFVTVSIVNIRKCAIYFPWLWLLITIVISHWRWRDWFHSNLKNKCESALIIKDNGNALFYGLPQNQISRLQHIQNTAARVVTLSRKSCHMTPILKELHWLPVSQRIVFKLMLIVHKSVNNIAPIYISELLKVYTPSRNLRSSNMSLLKEPTSKRTWGDRSFSVAAPRLWNHLPTKLKSCHSIN